MVDPQSLATSDQLAPRDDRRFVNSIPGTLVCGAKVLWLCGYATGVLIFSAYLFIGNDQGADFLRMLVEPLAGNARASLSTRVAFLLGVTLWSLATWYSCRLLLIRQLPGFPLPPVESAKWRVWTPRVLGALAPAIVTVGFYLLSQSATDRDLHRPLVWATAAYGALTVVLGIFYWRRRRWFPQLTGATPAEAQLAVLPRTSRWIVGVAIVLSFLLLVLFVFAPVEPARLLGTPAIFVAAGAGILLFGCIILNFVPMSYGYPGLLVPVLVYAAIVSLWNDNHGLRTARVVPFERRPPADQFDEWLQQALKEAPQVPASATHADSERAYPIFVVAAAGGGIRAAYWTALVLGAITDQTGAEAWRRHLYAASGVSGGSLGAAVHVVELAAPVAEKTYADHARRMLADDFLSPVTAFMLYPDLLQRFLPISVSSFLPSFDRARALELSWERSGAEVLKTDALAQPFVSLWQSHAQPVPALLLNSTRVQTGQRAIVSNVALKGVFLDTVDVLAPQDADSLHASAYTLAGVNALPLSTAIHLSARFTYVSPAATIRDSSGRVWGRLVDGGYFENSGAATAAELIGAVCERQTGEWRCGTKVPGLRPFPVLLLIKNDPQAPSVCVRDAEPKTSPTRLLTEVRSPIDALLAAREARGRFAESAILQQATGAGPSASTCDDGCVLEFALAKTPEAPGTTAEKAAKTHVLYNDPPLGWSLSETSRSGIENRLQDPDVQERLRCVRELVSGGHCASAPVCSR